MRRSHKKNKTKYHQVPRTAQQITCMHNSGRTRKSAHCIGPTATLARWCVTLTLTWRSHVGVGGGVCMSAPNAHQLPHLRRHSGVDQSPLCCRCVCLCVCVPQSAQYTPAAIGAIATDMRQLLHHEQSTWLRRAFYVRCEIVLQHLGV